MEQMNGLESIVDFNEPRRRDSSPLNEAYNLDLAQYAHKAFVLKSVYAGSSSCHSCNGP